MVIFVVKLKIRSFLLPHQGNLFCSCPKHRETAGYYNSAWQNSRLVGWLLLILQLMSLMWNRWKWSARNEMHEEQKSTNIDVS